MFTNETKDKSSDTKSNTEHSDSANKKNEERGAVLVVSLLVLTLLLGFVALAMSRSVTENAVASNDRSEAKTFQAAQSGLEDSTREFGLIFGNKLAPSDSDINIVKNKIVPEFTDNFNFSKEIKQIGDSEVIEISAGEFQGLKSLRDQWQIDVEAKEKSSDTQVKLTRRFFSDRIPLFQFGAFYQDDLELNRPPLFTFGGRLHTNSNLFVTASSASGIYFGNKVTVAGELIADLWKTGTSLSGSTDNKGKVFFKNAALDDVELATGSGSDKKNIGSVNCSQSSSGNTVLKSIGGRGRPFPYPDCTKNADWSNFAKRFDKNLLVNVKELRLPVDRLGVDLIEMMRRGKNTGDTFTGTVDSPILSQERYANKAGIRISLADSKQKLPQCAAAATTANDCGVRLDRSFGTSLGYIPKDSGKSGYKTTPVNGNRLADGNREVWIKIETVKFDNNTGKPVTEDITEDILSLGMTENLSGITPVTNYASGQDQYSIVKIQRFSVDGVNFNDSGNSYTTVLNNKNFVARYKNLNGYTNLCTAPLSFAPNPSKPLVTQTGCQDLDAFTAAIVNGSNSVSSNESQHLVQVQNSGTLYSIVPFPIQMYDSREGNRSDVNPSIGQNVYRNGVMSLIDIDVANLRRFLMGDLDDYMPKDTVYYQAHSNKKLKGEDIPEDRGWVVYFSDRRGDADFDGLYKMEDVNPNSNSLVDEDVNNNGVIDVDTNYREAPQINQQIDMRQAAVTDHGYYRRGVRLINATTLPGVYDSANEKNTKGFTFASENGVYIRGNYNTTGINVTPSATAPTSADAYQPQNTSLHIPASIVGDSITVLSNSWDDAGSFTDAFDNSKRVPTDTFLRFGMISGDSLTARTSASSGNFDGLNGGLHNFLRFLEDWGGNSSNAKRVGYTGSLINLYNSYNNNGKWKCCETVYNPPIRDWTFDNSFENPYRLPPGSPFVYSMTLTGFQRTE